MTTKRNWTLKLDTHIPTGLTSIVAIGPEIKKDEKVYVCETDRDSLEVSNLKNALESAPILRLGEEVHYFIQRYKEWYRTTRHEALVNK